LIVTITTFASPKSLSWSDFTTVSSKPTDPHDGSKVDALTQYEFFMPRRPARRVDGDYMLDDSLILLITPKCLVWNGVSKTARLLAHEQFHYDVGVVIARAAAKHFNRLRASTQAKLLKLLTHARNLHFVTRNKLIQQRYDIDTHHGTNAHYQKVWKDRMKKCLANPKADQIGGFFL
jgi:hypothetical protein